MNHAFVRSNPVSSPGSREEIVAETTPDPTSDPDYDEAREIASLIDDDGEPMAVTEIHRRALTYIWSLLR